MTRALILLLIGALPAQAADYSAQLSKVKTSSPKPQEPVLCCAKVKVETFDPGKAPTSDTTLPKDLPTPPAVLAHGHRAFVWLELFPPAEAGKAVPYSHLFVSHGRQVPLVRRNNRPGVWLELQDDSTTVTAVAIDPSGATFRSVWVVTWKDWKAFSRKPSDFMTGRNYWFSVGAAFSVLTYSETALTPGTLLAATAKLNAGYTFPFGLVLGGNAFGTTAVTPVSGLEGMSLRFLGANGRVGWSFNLPFLQSWIAVLGGVYFTTTFSEGNSLGFRNMTGPQLYPVFQIQPLPGHSFTTYAKYSPIWTGGGFAFDSFEIAAGVNYRPTRFLQGRTSASFDYSYLSLNILQILKIEVMSFNTGLNFHF